MLASRASFARSRATRCSADSLASSRESRAQRTCRISRRWRKIPACLSASVVQQMLLPLVMALATCFATAAERRRSLPADGMVPDPLFTSTHAISIDAPPERVWPWIVQMGSDRAGWYSWDAIDNGGTPSSRSIVPALQAIAPGDIMPAVPGAKDVFVVAAVEPDRDLILTVPDGHGGHAVAWEHFLQPLGGGRTRLIVRGRASREWLDLARSKPAVGNRRILIERAYAVLARLPRPLLIGFAALGHRIMEARHLRGIRRRSAAASAGHDASLAEH